MSTTDPKDTIDDTDRLREHFGAPPDIVLEVMKARLDEQHKRYIRNSPFLCIASADQDGQPAVSPRGDRPGFVTIVDDNTLVIPDRPGNRKVLTYSNLVQNPKVALIFFVPGVPETLRVEGEARLVLDADLLELGKTGARLPRAALVVIVQRVYVHCGKALIRSDLWNPAAHVVPGAVPTLAEIIRDHGHTPVSVEDAQREVDALYRDTLY